MIDVLKSSVEIPIAQAQRIDTMGQLRRALIMSADQYPVFIQDADGVEHPIAAVTMAGDRYVITTGRKQHGPS